MSSSPGATRLWNLASSDEAVGAALGVGPFVGGAAFDVVA